MCNSTTVMTGASHMRAFDIGLVLNCLGIVIIFIGHLVV